MSSLKWAGRVERMGDNKNCRREQMPRKWKENGCEEERESDRRNALRETGKMRENNSK